MSSFRAHYSEYEYCIGRLFMNMNTKDRSYSYSWVILWVFRSQSKAANTGWFHHNFPSSSCSLSRACYSLSRGAIYPLDRPRTFSVTGYSVSHVQHIPWPKSGVEISCNLFQLYARSLHHRHNHNCKLLLWHRIRNQAAEIMYKLKPSAFPPWKYFKVDRISVEKQMALAIVNRFKKKPLLSLYV